MLNTNKELEHVAPVAAKQPGFMTYDEAELQMKHGHAIRRASWPVDVHMINGKMIGVEPPEAQDDPHHDPADSNPDETRKLMRAGQLAAGKTPEKRHAPSTRVEKKLEKDDKPANDWTFWFPAEARTKG